MTRRAALLLAALLAGCGRSAAPAGAPSTTPTTPRSAPPSSAPPTTAPPTAAGAPTCQDVVASLTVRRQLAQLVMVGVDARTPADATAAVTEEGVGGIFVGGNATGLLVDGLAELQAAGELGVLVAVDDEGGRVQRVDALDGALPSARTMAATMSPEQVRALARTRGEALVARGVTMNIAPVLDVTAAESGVIGDRSFSGDPAVVTRYAGAFAAGLAEAGVVPVLKHFPGHGSADGDSHLDAVTTPPLEQLQARDLVPFRALVGTGAVMLGHLTVPGLTEPGLPASLSPAAVALLRGGSGYGAAPFDGLVMTDDLAGMGAVTQRFDLPEAVLAALQAGADLALWTSTARLGEVLDVLEAAVADGRLPAEQVRTSAARVLAARLPAC